MKRLLFCIVGITITLLEIRCQASYNKEVVELLKKDKFNYEIYELAFCINEVSHIIEQDTNYLRVLDQKIRIAADNNIKPELLYIHLLEIDFFKKMLDENNVKDKYPKAYSDFQKILPSKKSNITTSFTKIFNSYIEYPEQVDDICLIMLTCNLNCKAFEDIQKDKTSVWKYNNWLDYGFEEFRFFPGKTSKAKNIMNNRIIDYILKSEKCKDNNLVIKSKAMLTSKLKNG